MAKPADAADEETLIEVWLPENSLGIPRSTLSRPELFCQEFVSRAANKSAACAVVSFPKEKYIAIDRREDPASLDKVYADRVKRCQDDFGRKGMELQRDFIQVSLKPGETRDKARVSLSDFAASKKDDLIGYLEPDYCQLTRQAAAILIRHVPQCISGIGQLLPYLIDVDYGVRNGIGHCALAAALKIDTKTKIIAVDFAIRQLDFPHHSDRNKAISVTAFMVRDPVVANYVRENHMLKVKFIAENSVIPNVGGTAKEIIKFLATPESTPAGKETSAIDAKR